MNLQNKIIHELNFSIKRTLFHLIFWYVLLQINAGEITWFGEEKFKKYIKALMLTAVTAHTDFLRAAAIHVLFSAAQNAVRGILTLKKTVFRLQL